MSTGKRKTSRSKSTLREKYLEPPFSVLDSRSTPWISRKRQWLALGIQSELGRSNKITGSQNGGILMKSYSSLPGYYDLKRKAETERGRKLTNKEFNSIFREKCAHKLKFGTSIFDPVLCELMYSWFCPKGGTVIDPFAGGSVRGILASKLGRRYIGVELRREQVIENRAQAARICSDPLPEWIVGDSRNLDRLCEDVSADFIFSCPPYFDLEKYSRDPSDLSNMKPGDFLRAYQEIVRKSCALLKENRFACFVVGDVRDKRGFYRNFISYTSSAFLAVGLPLYNEAILVNMAGSLPLRVGGFFKKSRKLGKQHQNILVFVKGDPKQATCDCGEVELYHFPTIEEREAA